MKEDIERRFLPVEFRADAGNRTICGYAAMFNSVADMGWMCEQIAPGAFDDVETDTVALFNHDSNLVLGRKSAGTLRLKSDDKGLFMECDLPKTSYGDDLNESIARGDIKHQSFAFTVSDDEWSMKDGKEIRTIKKVKHLYDVSPVTYPAYHDTSVAKRSLEKSSATTGENSVDIDAENEEIDIELILNRHGE